MDRSKEALERLLKKASEDIRFLRQQNMLMRAKLDGLEMAMTLVRATAPDRGYSEASTIDVAWEIDRAVEALNSGEMIVSTKEAKDV